MQVIGLRKLNWDSMRVNFFVLTPPAVLKPYPASWITSFYLAPEKADFVNRLIAEFPNLTVVDVAAILQQLQSVMNLSLIHIFSQSGRDFNSLATLQ